MNKLLKTLSLLFALSCAQAPGLLQAKGYPEFPYSDDMDVVVVANNMDYNGLPMRAFQFSSSADEAEVVAFYEREWGEEMTNILFGDWRILSHKEGDYLMTVQIEQNTMAKTHGTLGITPMFKLVDAGSRHVQKLQAGIGKDFPMPPRSEVINDIRADDGGINSRTIMFANSQSVLQNIKFYLRKMQAQGWEILGGYPESLDNLTALAMNKGGQKLNLSFVSREGKTYGVATTLN